MYIVSLKKVCLMRPVSNEKRELIVEAKKRGESEKNIMKWVKNTSRSTIVKI